jgi:hypothetical protein
VLAAGAGMLPPRPGMLPRPPPCCANAELVIVSANADARITDARLLIQASIKA